MIKTNNKGLKGSMKTYTTIHNYTQRLSDLELNLEGFRDTLLSRNPKTAQGTVYNKLLNLTSYIMVVVHDSVKNIERYALSLEQERDELEMALKDLRASQKAVLSSGEYTWK